MDPTRWKLRTITCCVCLFVPDFSSPLTGPSEVTGPLGGSLTVQCLYEARYENNDKYWCHGWTSLCSDLVRSTEHQRSVSKGRISIRDDPASHSFRVTMERLRWEDDGWYQCGVSIEFGRDPTIAVKVTVLPAATTIKTTRSTKATKHAWAARTTTSTQDSTESSLERSATTTATTQDSTASSLERMMDENTADHPSPTINSSSGGQFSSTNILTSLITTSILLLLLIVLTTVCFYRKKHRKRQAAKSEARNGEPVCLDTDSAGNAEITYHTVNFGGREQQQSSNAKRESTSGECVYTMLENDIYHSLPPQ